MAFILPDSKNLQDEMILLRKWEDRDIVALVSACSDDGIRRWLWHIIPQPYSESEARVFVSSLAPDDWRSGRAAHFAVADLDDRNVLGSVALMAVEGESNVGEIGAWTVPKNRGLGIAGRAARLVAWWGLYAVGLDRLKLFIAESNIESRRAAERAGFRPTQVLHNYRELSDGKHNVVVYIMSRSELPASRDLLPLPGPRHRKYPSAGRGDRRAGIPEGVNLL